jgi:hypothetical protein
MENKQAAFTDSMPNNSLARLSPMFLGQVVKTPADVERVMMDVIAGSCGGRDQMLLLMMDAIFNIVVQLNPKMHGEQALRNSHMELNKLYILYQNIQNLRSQASSAKREL